MKICVNFLEQLAQGEPRFSASAPNLCVSTWAGKVNDRILDNTRALKLCGQRKTPFAERSEQRGFYKNHGKDFRQHEKTCVRNL